MKRTALFLSALCVFSMVQAQFKGKMEFSGSGDKIVYTVFSDLSQYRYEFEENGQKMFVITKPDAGQALILMPEMKMYMKTATTDIRSMMNDPVQASRHFNETMEEKSVGKEHMNGYDCIKKEYYTKNSQPKTLIYTVWYSDDLKMPVKIIDHVRGRSYMELREVEEWDPVASYFEVPSGYQEMNMGQTPH